MSAIGRTAVRAVVGMGLGAMLAVTTAGCGSDDGGGADLPPFESLPATIEPGS